MSSNCESFMVHKWYNLYNTLSFCISLFEDDAMGTLSNMLYSNKNPLYLMLIPDLAEYMNFKDNIDQYNCQLNFAYCRNSIANFQMNDPLKLINIKIPHYNKDKKINKEKFIMPTLKVINSNFAYVNLFRLNFLHKFEAKVEKRNHLKTLNLVMSDYQLYKSVKPSEKSKFKKSDTMQLIKLNSARRNEHLEMHSISNATKFSSQENMNTEKSNLPKIIYEYKPKGEKTEI
ncbi:hypothetical protein A3Q56_06408 [Intoshia linei]|uniref:Uncharacterized protein n=1 Tax=Intoshia linei TaxID=1819745 RepID=A0A177AXG1_9BILA|nr:hypothetical protein A3Q56_06408 [Intoshia linei]